MVKTVSAGAKNENVKDEFLSLHDQHMHHTNNGHLIVNENYAGT